MCLQSEKRIFKKESGDVNIPAGSKQEMELEVLKIPKKHEFYKFLIVEELAFFRNLDDFHHGKCSTIGTIICEDNFYYLENLRIKAFSKKYWLPDGSLKIRLLLQGYFGRIEEGKTAEVSGQAVLCDPKSTACFSYTTSAAVAAKIKEVVEEATDKKAEVITAEREKLKKQYEPALLVHRIRSIDRARDLIERNLQMRMLEIYDKYEY